MMRLGTSSRNRVALVCLLVMVAGMCAVGAAPARVSAKPVDEAVIKVYAYKVPSLAVVSKTAPGFLVELVQQIITHPELPVEVQVLPAAVLMKYSLIQSVGVAAVALESDFSQVELKDLVGIPLYERGGKVYSLYLNNLNPRAADLYERTATNLAQVRANGVYDELLRTYKLQ